MPDMHKQWKEAVIPAMMKARGYRNVMQVPRLRKITVSTGIKSSVERDAFTEAKENLALITGQLPVVTKSRRDVANFKVRRGMPVGLMVTLRGRRMHDFFDRLVHIVLPRIRDFRGVPPKGFDGSGNYNLGFDDITVFPEVDPDKLKRQMGLNVAIVTSAGTDEDGRELLRLLEMPFASAADAAAAAGGKDVVETGREATRAGKEAAKGGKDGAKAGKDTAKAGKETAGSGK
jgi:large subunit ribosomal protein L5